MALVLAQITDTEGQPPAPEGDDVQPSLELLLHLAQWETAEGEFMDPMLLSEDEEMGEGEQSEADSPAEEGGDE